MKRIIVTRFSAMGDVAMVASVLKVFQAQNLDTEIIFVSRKAFDAFFDYIPRLTLHHIEPQGKHKGFFGLWELHRELSVYKADFFADLHHNLRSKILTTLANFGAKVKVLNKGREEKNALTRKSNKIFKQLKPTTERYADVFRALGFTITLDHQLKKEDRPIPKEFTSLLSLNAKVIGIAPFAQHVFKVFPLQKMERVVEYLAKNNYLVFVFGGGQQERLIAEEWSKKYDNVENVIGKFCLTEELNLIANLDLMVSMDSAAMHMASLVGTRSISVWGTTHPFAGFLGYGQSLQDCVHVEHAYRPSSVYGNKSCLCDGVEAIDLVTPNMIIDKINFICA